MAIQKTLVANFEVFSFYLSYGNVDVREKNI